MTVTHRAGTRVPMQQGAEPLRDDEIKGAWTFKSEEVAGKFDQHVREQLPWYDTLSRFTADVAVSFIPRDGVIYDIGASTGNITSLLSESIEEKSATAISIEPSHQMSALWKGSGDLLVVPAENIDFNNKRADLVIMFLTLMFVPPKHRDEFVTKILKSVNPGGAVIIVDKGYIDVPMAQVACKAATVAEKNRQGTSAEAYVRKELSLRGEQRPTSASRLSDIAASNLFDCQEFFRFGEFYGLLLIKSSI